VGNGIAARGSGRVCSIGALCDLRFEFEDRTDACFLGPRRSLNERFRMEQLIWNVNRPNRKARSVRIDEIALVPTRDIIQKVDITFRLPARNAEPLEMKFHPCQAMDGLVRFPLRRPMNKLAAGSF